MALIAGQDVEPADEDPTSGRWRIARKVAADRVISTVDPQARHVHKTVRDRTDGFKAHVAVEPETGLVTACMLTGGNTHDGDTTVITDLLKGETAVRVLADSAYGAGATRAHLRSAGHTAVIKPKPLPRPKLPDGLGRDDFTINHTARQASVHLYQRLVACLASAAEHNLFRAYGERYGELGFDLPALIPQVWLHYDPKSAWQRDGDRPLNRQRMDFLLPLAGRRRVVIEVDGIQHYCDETGRPSPAKYAEMVCADRDLRLAGYEVYRFGGAELMTLEAARALLGPFLDALVKTGR